MFQRRIYATVIGLAPLPGTVYLATVIWAAVDLPFPIVEVPLGAGHSMHLIDFTPEISFRQGPLTSWLLILMTVVGLLTGLLTSRRSAGLGRGPLVASAVVIAAYLALLVSAELRLSAVSSLVIDNEHSRAEIFHATVVYYASAAAVCLMTIWTGAGLARLYRLSRVPEREQLPGSLGER